MRSMPAAGLACAVLLMAPAVTAAGSAPAPKPEPEPAMVSDTCSVCHGEQGIADRRAFPDLAGQIKSYLVTELQSFRGHTRGEPMARAYMWSVAGPLSDKTMNAVADYFAAQAPPKGASGENAGEIAAGRTIFAQGISSENVPPCGACHGPSAAGTETAPRLAGQHREYLLAQLEAFRSNARDNAIMHGNVEHMTDAQMRQITAYLAAL